MYMGSWQQYMFWYLMISCQYVYGKIWKFATSSNYVNLRILPDESEELLTFYIPKVLPLTLARMHCAKYCTDNNDCLAFNLYENNDVHVCELLPDNLCIDRANKAVVPQAGGVIWDKIAPESTKTCIDILTVPEQGIPCRYMRPGCDGTWPNCINCTKTCIDCYRRQLPTCVMWPDDDLDSMPIIGRCVQENTVLMARRVSPITGNVLQNYRMALYDMHRISRLNVYKTIQFYFSGGLSQRFAKYWNWTIDANGTLKNLVYAIPVINFFEDDILSLKGGVLSPAPFVEVTDDRYGCGAFWLLDPSNATYCPGGETSLLGKVTFDGTKVVKTGINCVSCTWIGLAEYGSVELLV